MASGQLDPDSQRARRAGFQWKAIGQVRSGGSPDLELLTYSGHHLIGRGKSLDILLGHPIAVDPNAEFSGGSRSQSHFDSIALLNLAGQTGCSGFVVSGRTVADLDGHRGSPLI